MVEYYMSMCLTLVLGLLYEYVADEKGWAKWWYISSMVWAFVVLWNLFK